MKEALDAVITASFILNEGLIAAMPGVGRRFDDREYFVPEMLIAVWAMKSGFALLKPHLQGAEVKSSGRIIIGTVRDDQHYIGKNLVAMMLEEAGLEVHDLGTDIALKKFVKAIRTYQAIFWPCRHR